MTENKTALIVDDDNLTGEVLDAVLLGSGYRISRADNGRAALSLADGRCFDVVIAGYWIEDMSGTDFVKRMRERCADSFIIGTSLERQEAAFYRAGADAFLKKPFSFRELAVLLGYASL